MKVRAPLTTDQALARIIGQLPNGYRDAEKATDRSESYLRACGDPDRLERLCFDDAIALDIAFQAAGGEGSPLAEHFLLRVEMGQLARFAHRFGLLEKTEQVVRESGEASAALIRACQPGAGPLEQREAFRELVEAVEAMKPVIAALDPDNPIHAIDENEARAPP
jgi:hypothetical protein